MGGPRNYFIFQTESRFQKYENSQQFSYTTYNVIQDSLGLSIL